LRNECLFFHSREFHQFCFFIYIHIPKAKILLSKHKTIFIMLRSIFTLFFTLFLFFEISGIFSLIFFIINSKKLFQFSLIFSHTDLLSFTLLLIVPKPWASAGLTLSNQCSYPVWPGIQSSPGKPVVSRGGLFLAPKQELFITLPQVWSGLFWARTGCTFNAAGEGKCVTGDCGSKLYCNGLGGAMPATIARLAYDDHDLYNVSFVDGYNVPITITPYTGPDDYKCHYVGCKKDLSALCPAGLQVHSPDNKTVVACKSPCENSKTCGPNEYSRIFKKACPKAYTSPSDKEPSSIVPCADASYIVTFCPTSKK